MRIAERRREATTSEGLRLKEQEDYRYYFLADERCGDHGWNRDHLIFSSDMFDDGHRESRAESTARIITQRAP